MLLRSRLVISHQCKNLTLVVSILMELNFKLKVKHIMDSIYLVVSDNSYKITSAFLTEKAWRPTKEILGRNSAHAVKSTIVYSTNTAFYTIDLFKIKNYTWGPQQFLSRTVEVSLLTESSQGKRL